MHPEYWAAKFPKKAAAINSETGESVTYSELSDRCNRLVNLMRAKGLVRGDSISVLMENNLRFFEVMWAALSSGLYVTPINKFLNAEEVAYIVNDSDAKLLITSYAMREVAEQLPARCANCQHFLAVDGEINGYESLEFATSLHSTVVEGPKPFGEFMNYSSGITGRPKGIKWPLRDVTVDNPKTPLGRMHKELWGFDETTIYLSTTPLYHSAPSAFAASTQKWGGTVVMMPRFDPTEALRAIEKYQVTHSQWVPTMFIRMLKLPEEERLKYDLSSLRVAVHLAAPCPVDVKKAMLAWWGEVIYELYGGTELNGATHATPREWLENPGTVGKPVLGVLHICDDDGNELPPNQSGTVFFELPRLRFQYHKDPTQTRDAVHPTHKNWSALGDVGYVNERGFLFLNDRKTFMINSGGVNIYPQEIEDVLVQHPKIDDVAVIGVHNEEMGEEVKAIVQLAPNVEPSDALAEEFIRFARTKLAKYKVPKSVDFIDELPRLPTGKLYKNKLRDKYWGDRKSRII
jgi:long-chain acyl-CoA synthetase